MPSVEPVAGRRPSRRSRRPRSARAAARAASIMRASRAFISAWSCTARRTSPSTARTPSASAASSASGAFLSISKCMTLSRHVGLAGVQDAAQPAVVAALGADHGVDHGAHRVALRGELVGDGVDEERRVLGVRLDDRADRRVAVAGERRVEGAHGDVGRCGRRRARRAPMIWPNSSSAVRPAPCRQTGGARRPWRTPGPSAPAPPSAR